MSPTAGGAQPATLQSGTRVSESVGRKTVFVITHFYAVITNVAFFQKPSILDRKSQLTQMQ